MKNWVGMGNVLQIVAFDVPDPPDYGGAVDVFYKISALAEAGIEIHLHCFDYGRGPSSRLESLCASVQYYRRQRNPLKFLDRRPFIVATRDNKTLLNNLLKRETPIWIEGLHGGSVLESKVLKAWPRFLRTHNVEHHYYQSLANVSSFFAQKIYLQREARKLETYESILNEARRIFPLSRADTDYFQHRFSAVSRLPVFQSQTSVAIPEGRGDYVLYHGNLAVAENDQAARYLVTEIFNALEIPLVIAGRYPSRALKQEAAARGNIRLVEPQTVPAMDQWIREAQIHILPTFQSTGLKLKLLKALFTGRHVLVNEPMLTDPELRSVCSVFTSPEDARDQIHSRIQVPVPAEVIEAREQLLKTTYNPQLNADRMIKEIFV
ncbi:MAG: glycosyltransferase family 4 protein [FCB group bacterium]|nr:glycosyltransferase family 4 protein [FCB group bacterium]